MQVRQAVQQRPQLLVEMLAAGFGQAEKRRPLPHENHHADAGSKTHNHRHGDEAYHAAEAEQAHKQQYDAGKESGDLQAVEAEFGGDAGEDGDKRAGGAGNLHA